MERILIIEDEAEMASLLMDALSEEGYSCEIASNGPLGLKLASGFDVLLVDVMLPKMSGFEVVRSLREMHCLVPVIFLTAKDQTKDIVHGLQIGASDYIVKPFRFDELLARIKATLRDSRKSGLILKWEDFDLDCQTRLGKRGGIDMFLSLTEFALLEQFVRNTEVTLSKGELLKAVWKDEGYRDPNIVEIYVGYLRKKTEIRSLPRVIHTVRGEGYVLRKDKP